MTRKRRFRSLIFLVYLTFLVPVPGYAAQILADPFFSYESQGDDYTFRGLGPILELSSQATAIRPFYYKDRENSRTEFIYPLGRFSQERSRFVPLFRSADQGDDKHTDLFPVFYGRYRETPYGGIFPLYGTMVHRFGFDEARFILFPLYAETRTSEVSTYSYLWPVISYSKGRLFRVFPLYGQEKTADSTYRFFLWPIFHHERGFDRSLDAALPLFRYDRGSDHKSISVIWPFFTYNVDSSLGHVSVDCPWPLIRTASGAYEETRLFPVYWTKTEGKTYSMRTYLWPIWSTTSSHDKETNTDEKTVTVLLMNRVTRKTSQDGQTARKVILWPFFYSSREGVRSEWYVPSIFPLFFDEGFAHTWGPVLSIAQGTSDAATSRMSILWRTIFWETREDTTRWNISMLVSSEKTPGYRQWGFLGNLLTFRRNTAPESH